MSDFLEKLKKGMEVEETKTVSKQPKPKKVKKTKSFKIKTQQIEAEPKKEKEPKKEESALKSFPLKNLEKAEGQLTVDVYQTETDLVLQSPIAGIKPQDLDITIEEDLITIKGIRENPEAEKKDYFTKECYWGPFSREVILPVEVDSGRATAVMKEGVLTIRIPKIIRQGKRKIIVKE